MRNPTTVRETFLICHQNTTQTDSHGYPRETVLVALRPPAVEVLGTISSLLLLVSWKSANLAEAFACADRLLILNPPGTDLEYKFLGQNDESLRRTKQSVNDPTYSDQHMGESKPEG